MECFDKAEELHVLDLAAIGHLVLLYMESTKIADINEIQKDFPSSITDKEKFRDDISRKIVDKIYCNPNTKEVLNVSIDMVRHNAVKETDGPRVIIHWKFDV